MIKKFPLSLDPSLKFTRELLSTAWSKFTEKDSFSPLLPTDQIPDQSLVVPLFSLSILEVPEKAKYKRLLNFCPPLIVEAEPKEISLNCTAPPPPYFLNTSFVFIKTEIPPIVVGCKDTPIK